MRYPFQDIVSTESELREILGYPSERAVKKQIASLDKHARAYIEQSPFAALATANAVGRLDVTPRGDGPGFVNVLDDHTLLIPERPGNKRGDTLSNIVENPRAAVLFLVPTLEITLRVNGLAAIVRDEALLQQLTVRDKTPTLAIAVEAQEVFFHCAKAFKRSNLWNPETWQNQDAFPTLGAIIFDQMQPDDMSVSEMDASIEEGYATNLY